MPPARHRIDPATLRFPIAANGEIEGDASHASEVLFLLRLRKGSAAAYPEWGSELHKITTLDARAPTMAERYATAAVQPMIDDGRVKSVTPKATIVGQVLVLVVNYVDAAGTRGLVTVKLGV